MPCSLRSVFCKHVHTHCSEDHNGSKENCYLEQVDLRKDIFDVEDNVAF